MEICLKILEEQFVKSPLVLTEPIVNYKETVTNQELSDILFVKSSNKHNRLWGQSQGMSSE